jgi:hypothetical protein
MLAFVFLIACAGRDRQKQRRQASGHAYQGKSLAVILPDSASVSLRDSRALSDPLRDAFPGDSAGNDNARLASAFKEAFWSAFSPAVDYAAPFLVSDSVPPAPEDRRLRVSEPALHFGTPAQVFLAPDSAWLAEHGAGADLVLVIGPLSAADERSEIGTHSFAGSVRTSKLLLAGNYILWDYSARRAIAHGRFRSKVVYGNKLNAEDWMKAFDAAVASVGNALPFRGPKWYRRGRTGS